MSNDVIFELIEAPGGDARRALLRVPQDELLAHVNSMYHMMEDLEGLGYAPQTAVEKIHFSLEGLPFDVIAIEDANTNLVDALTLTTQLVGVVHPYDKDVEMGPSKFQFAVVEGSISAGDRLMSFGIELDGQRYYSTGLWLFELNNLPALQRWGGPIPGG